MTTKINIISNVYGEFGRPPINSLSPTKNTDIVASNLYDLEVPAILSEFNYPSARVHVKLNELSTPPTDTRYLKAFQLPNDMLVFLYPDELNFDYLLIGTQMWTNVNEVRIYYTRWDSSMERYFNPTLNKYLFIVMCSLLAYPITQQENVQQAWEKKAERYYGVVSAVTSRQEPSEVISDSRMLQAFRGG